jgi:hypothetical protein
MAASAASSSVGSIITFSRAVWRTTYASFVSAGRPSVRRSIVAVDRLARRSASLRPARYRRSFRRPCDRPATDFRGMSARNFDGICSVPVISPRNLATKFSDTTRRPSLFDPCFRRKNPPVNGRAAIFFRFFSHRFRRGYPLERPFTEGFRAFAACGLFPLPTKPAASGSDAGNTIISYFAGSLHLYRSARFVWLRSLRLPVFLLVLPPTRERGVGFGAAASSCGPDAIVLCFSVGQSVVFHSRRDHFHSPL